MKRQQAVRAPARILAQPDGGWRAVGPHLLNIMEEYAEAVVRLRAWMGQLNIIPLIQHRGHHLLPQSLQQQIADPLKNRFLAHGPSLHFAA